MKTEDPFEQQLRQWVREIPRHDPTPAWKDEILKAASATKPRPRFLPSRPVMLAWAAMWMIGLILRFTTPDNPIPPGPLLSPVVNLTTDQLFAALLP